MSWKLRCPFCRIEYKIEPEHQGTVCKCAKCGKEFSIPDDIQAWLDSMPDPPGSGQGGPKRRAIAPDPEDDDPVDLRDDPLDERNHDFRYCSVCGKKTIPASDYCSYCGYSFSTRTKRDNYGNNGQFRYCCWCGRKLRATAVECPTCEMLTCFDIDLEEQPKPARPFLCGVLNIIGGFAVGLSGLTLLLQLIAAGVEFFHPSEHSYIRDGTGAFFKTVMFGFAVFFGGMVVLGISQAVARASRRW